MLRKGDSVSEAEWMIDRQIDRHISVGSPGRGKISHSTDRFGQNHISNSGFGWNKPEKYYNEYLKPDDFRALMNFLTVTLSPRVRLTPLEAKRFIMDNLIKRGKYPVRNFSRLNHTEKANLQIMLDKFNMEIEGYDRQMDELVALEKERQKANFKIQNEEENNMLPKTEVKTMFTVRNEEEGEKVLYLTRGMASEAVAVSYSYPHYKREGFYAEKKSNVFAKEMDEQRITVSMGEVFGALAVTLNNLLASEKLTEENYNKLLDGYEPFILEALDFEEIEPMLDTERGLKSGRKKRISNSKPKKK